MTYFLNPSLWGEKYIKAVYDVFFKPLLYRGEKNVFKMSFTIHRLLSESPDYLSIMEWLSESYQKAVAEELASHPKISERQIDLSKKSEVKYYLETLIADKGQNCFLILKNQDKKPCGYFFATIRDYLGETPPKVGYINGIYIEPALRHQQLGQKLLDEALLWFKKMNLPFVELYTSVGNEAAKKFWKKNGFAVTEEVYLRKV